MDLDQDGKHTGFLRLPHSVHRSAYGCLPIPVVCIKRGDGPTLLLNRTCAAGQSAARIHDPESPWNTPTELVFAADARVICQRVPARVERGDCLYELAVPMLGSQNIT